MSRFFEFSFAWKFARMKIYLISFFFNNRFTPKRFFVTDKNSQTPFLFYIYFIKVKGKKSFFSQNKKMNDLEAMICLGASRNTKTESKCNLSRTTLNFWISWKKSFISNIGQYLTCYAWREKMHRLWTSNRPLL